jgi:thioredoxin reductase (NADPH)
MMGPSWRKMFCSESTRANTDRILRDPCIEVHLHTMVGELIGERGVLEGVGVEDIEDGSRFTLPASEVMVFLGADPCTAWLAGTLALDSGRCLRTGPDAVSPDHERAEGPVSPPELLETNVPGVFAAVDVGSGSVKRVASAVGEGAMGSAWRASTWRRCGSGEVMAWPVRRAFRSSSGSSAR